MLIMHLFSSIVGSERLQARKVLRGALEIGSKFPGCMLRCKSGPHVGQSVSDLLNVTPAGRRRYENEARGMFPDSTRR